MNPTVAIKEARTERDVHPLVRQRFSPRAFTEEPVSEQEILTLFEAASWAPSSMNEQPWRFRYTLRGEAEFEMLKGTFSGGNLPWAPNAAAIVAISGMKHHERGGLTNASWSFDTGIAVGNLLLQATAMGLHGHLLGGFDHAQTALFLEIDGEKEGLICLLVLGRLGEAETLDEPYRTRERAPRVRKPLNEVASRIRF